MKIEKLKIGQEVFIIENNLEITPREIIAIVNEEKETKYKLDVNSCGGISETDFYLTKRKAEVAKQNFLDDLKFKVGDLLIFKYKEYHRTEIDIGKVKEIRYNGLPYHITTSYKNIHDLSDEDIVLKINNEYIENFGKLQDLNIEFKKADEEVSRIIKSINFEHDLLEKDLKQKFKKQFPWYSNKKKPLFKDSFDYEEEDYY